MIQENIFRIFLVVFLSLFIIYPAIKALLIIDNLDKKKLGFKFLYEIGYPFFKIEKYKKVLSEKEYKELDKCLKKRDTYAFIIFILALVWFVIFYI